MEAAVDELSRGLSLASARDGGDGGDGGDQGGAEQARAEATKTSAAAERVQELERRKEAKKFDGMASSLFDALDAVPVRPKSLLEDSPTNAGAASSTREDFGRGLSVIDQFALRQHSSQARAGDLGGTTYNLDGTARTKPGAKAAPAPTLATSSHKSTTGALSSFSFSGNVGASPAAGKKSKNLGNLSRKARQRKEKSRQRGQAYSEKQTSGPSRRGRVRGKSNRLAIL